MPNPTPALEAFFGVLRETPRTWVLDEYGSVYNDLGLSPLDAVQALMASQDDYSLIKLLGWSAELTEEIEWASEFTCNTEIRRLVLDACALTERSNA